MTDSASANPDLSRTASAELAARAAELRIVVVGGGVSGLVAARECAKLGMQVVVLETSDMLGGAIRSAELDGVTVDAGAESFATRGGHVRALLDELGLTERIVTPASGGAWIAGIPGVGAAPLPVGGILGIPENPFQPDVRRVIGWRGVWRAYLDRVRPPLTIGHDRSLGRLVSSRMGAAVRDRLVAPVTTGVYSAAPEDVDVDLAAPGLNAALTSVGSLSGAVQVLRDKAAQRAQQAPGSAVEGIEGGMSVLVEALRADLLHLGAEVRTAAPVVAVTRSGAHWRVDVDCESEVSEPGPAAQGEVDRGAENTLVADAVVLATPESVARGLLASEVPALSRVSSVPAPEIEVVTLLLNAPELDEAPRGSGVLTVPGSHSAKALTHSSAKWGWVRAAAGGRHVVRVSFGAQGESAATAGLDDAEAARLALSEAAALLGVPLEVTALVAAHRAGYTQSQPASIIGAGERRAAARAAIQSTPGLAAVGAWLAGTGLAQVIPDAKAEADRLRHALLWSRGDDERSINA